MSRPLATREAALVEGTTLAAVTLVAITTYADRVTQSSPVTHYLSDAPRLWSWDGGARQQFLPRLVSIAPFVDQTPHLADPTTTGIELERLRTITLRNRLEEVSGSYLDDLTASGARSLLNARVEIAQVFSDGREWWNLDSLSGAGEVPIYVGRVRAIEQITEAEIRLTLALDLASFPWLYADDAAKNDPRDLGKRLPVAVGRAQRVECIGWEVGWVTTLSQGVSAGATALEVTDASGLGTSGSARVNQDTFSWTGKSGNQLTGVTGIDSAHAAGETIIEDISPEDVEFVASAREADAVNDVYVLSPFTGELIRIDPALYSTTLADTSVITGETLAMIRFTQANLEQLLDDLAQAAQVTQQPGVNQQPVVAHAITNEISGQHVPAGNITGVDSTNAAQMSDGNSGTYAIFGSAGGAGGVTPDTGGVTMTFPSVNGVIVSQTIRLYIRTPSNFETGCEADERLALRLPPGGPFSTLVGSVEHGTTGVFSFTTTEDEDEFRLEAEGSGLSDEGWVLGVYHVERDVTYDQPDPSLSTGVGIAGTAGTQVIVGGSSVGFGLRIFADVDGEPIPAASGYENTAGDPVESGADVIRYVLQELLGYPQANILGTSDVETNLGANVYAGDLRHMGHTTREILAQLAFETRTNIVPVFRAAGLSWALTAASGAGAFPAAGGAITDYSAILRQLEEDPATRLEFLHTFRPFEDDGAESGFQGIAAFTSSAGETKLGRIDGGARGLVLVTDQATAEDVRDWFGPQKAEPGPTYRVVGVPAREAYDLEPGDIRTLTRPDAFGGGTAKARVLGVSWDIDRAVAEVVLREVA